MRIYVENNLYRKCSKLCPDKCIHVLLCIHEDTNKDSLTDSGDEIVGFSKVWELYL